MVTGSAASGSFLISSELRDGVAILQPRGDLDMATAPILEEAINDAERDLDADIVVDLRQVPFLDVSGLHPLVQAHRRFSENGRGLRVRGVSQFTRKVFELTGAGHVLESDEGDLEGSRA
jgi:anti-sigma B factor antagonist